MLPALCAQSGYKKHSVFSNLLTNNGVDMYNSLEILMIRAI